MNTRKLTRQSLNGTEYQLEYIPVPARSATEYRVRRGAHGTWTRWINTHRISTVIQNLGFGNHSNELHDFAFEALLGRGVINLNKAMVKRIADNAGMNATSARVFSRLKQNSEDSWTLPASAVSDEIVFNYLKNIIINCKGKL